MRKKKEKGIAGKKMKQYNKGNTAQFKAHGLLEYYSVSLPKNQPPYVSMRTDYLSNLTKNLTAQSAHLNYAVLPKRKTDEIELHTRRNALWHFLIS